MIRISKNISFIVPTTGSGESEFFTLGEAAQEKLYAMEHVPYSAGGAALIFPLLSLALAAAGILLSFSRLGHSATVSCGHHRTKGAPQTSQKRAIWAPVGAVSALHSPVRSTKAKLIETKENAIYGQKGQLYTRENDSL
jgi:hypothetical protein